MPTGYTAAIADGISLRQFILSCSRAMGACIMQRDDPADELPKKHEPSDYHTKKIVEAEALLSEIKGMSDEVASVRAANEYNEEIARIESTIRKNNILKGKYEIMLAEVQSWAPPTSEHQGLKDFMVSQIVESIKFDCGSYYKDLLNELKPLSVAEWKDKKTKEALHDLDYHQREHNEELQRCRLQNKWIEELYSSLPTENSTSCAQEIGPEQQPTRASRH